MITGTSTGIGEATALHLAKLGYRVLAGVRKEGDGERLVDQAGSGLVPVLIDVTEPATIDEAVRTVTDTVGEDGLVGLVNNAGVAIGGPLEYLAVEQWRHQFEVNVLGPVAVTRAFLPLIRQGGGRIIFIGSIGGRVAAPFVGPYSASKFAVEAIAESLRQELQPWHIPVVVIEPGAIKTPIWEKGLSQADEIEAALPRRPASDTGRRSRSCAPFCKCRIAWPSRQAGSPAQSPTRFRRRHPRQDASSDGTRWRPPFLPGSCLIGRATPSSGRSVRTPDESRRAARVTCSRASGSGDHPAVEPGT